MTEIEAIRLYVAAALAMLIVVFITSIVAAVVTADIHDGLVSILDQMRGMLDSMKADLDAIELRLDRLEQAQ